MAVSDAYVRVSCDRCGDEEEIEMAWMILQLQRGLRALLADEQNEALATMLRELREFSDEYRPSDYALNVAENILVDAAAWLDRMHVAMPRGYVTTIDGDDARVEWFGERWRIVLQIADSPIGRKYIFACDQGYEKMVDATAEGLVSELARAR